MISAKHNFTQNFCSAIGYGDNFMLQNIIIDEIAKLIVDNKNDVVYLLRSQGVNITINDNNEVIKNRLINEMAKGNQNVINSISKMIISYRFDQHEFMNLFGITLGKKAKQEKKVKEGLEKLKAKVGTSTTTTSEKKKESTFWNKLGSALKTEQAQEGAANLISLGIKKIFNKSTPSTTTSNTQVLSERLKVNEAKQTASKTKKISTATIIILSIATAGLITLIIIAVRKSKKAE